MTNNQTATHINIHWVDPGKLRLMEPGLDELEEVLWDNGKYYLVGKFKYENSTITFFSNHYTKEDTNEP